MRKAFLFTLVGVFGLASFCGAEKIPIESFFASVDFKQFRISPDGRYLSALGPWKDATNLFVFDLENRRPVRVTAIKNQTINNHFWANNERLVFTMDFDGNESWGLYAVNRDGSKSRELVPPIRSTRTFVFRYVRPLDILTENHDEILIINNARRIDYPDVMRLNIYTGKQELHTANPGNFTGWRTDQQGRVRFAEARNEDVSTEYFVRKSEESAWEKITVFPFGERGWKPIAPQDYSIAQVLKPLQQPFSHDGKYLYISSQIGRDTAGIYMYDIASRKIEKLLFEAPGYDVSNLVISDHKKAPLGIYYHTDKPQVHWFDMERRQVQQFLDAKFPNFFSKIVATNEDHSRLVVGSYSDRHPPLYSLIRLEGGKLKFELLSGKTTIDPKKLSEMKPIVITARDGWSLHGYLTLPKGGKGEPFPLIMHPHGGPWVRDVWGFNATVQFLANRGFAVLQVNFRSSNGYGFKHLHAGNKSWATSMQHDLIDSVNWAINQGHADPERIGIYGASYGGFATMVQLTQHPEVYRFGINFVGPVDLIDLINWRRKWEQYSVYNYYCQTIGHPEEEQGALKAASPIYHIEKIRAPVFIIHGTQDPRVPIGQATKLRKALKKHKKPHEWFVKKDEGHGFKKGKNRIALFERIEAFIAPYGK